VVAKHRDNDVTFTADTVAELEAEIETDYEKNPMRRKCRTPSIVDYLDPDGNGALEEAKAAADEIRPTILRALRNIFPFWDITYAPQIRAWLARREGKAVCENSPELLVTALALIEQKWINGQNCAGQGGAYPWPVVSFHGQPLTGTERSEPTAATLDQDWRTVAEVATIMRVSKSTVYKLVHRGNLEAVRIGRFFRVPAQAVATCLAGQLTPAARPGHPDSPATD
jgi:excisionase family DNA binding protein